MKNESPSLPTYCRACGRSIDPRAVLCPSCGVAQAPAGAVLASRSGEKSPAIAILISFIWPGSGHLYLGRSEKAIVLMIASFLMFCLAFTALFPIALLVDLALAIYAMFDANRLAKTSGSMTAASDPTGPAPGWHRDPLGESTWRWWSGHGWTESTSEGQTGEERLWSRPPSPPPSASPATDDPNTP